MKARATAPATTTNLPTAFRKIHSELTRDRTRTAVAGSWVRAACQPAPVSERAYSRHRSQRVRRCRSERHGARHRKQRPRCRIPSPSVLHRQRSSGQGLRRSGFAPDLRGAAAVQAAQELLDQMRTETEAPKELPSEVDFAKENEALRKLRLAEQLFKSNATSGRKWLQEVVDKFPETTSAVQAKKMLGELE